MRSAPAPTVARPAPTLTVDAAIQPHTPGQFVNLGLERGSELVRRSYSIASAPGAPLEFYLKEVPGGALTQPGGSSPTINITLPQLNPSPSNAGHGHVPADDAAVG